MSGQVMVCFSSYILMLLFHAGRPCYASVPIMDEA